MNKKGVLLVNLGTPRSASVADVRKFLGEFLMDGRVIATNSFRRWLIVKGLILPFRSPKTAKLYQAIWSEKGSPLLYYSKRQQGLLQERLGEDYLVELGMRYQTPSIASALANLKVAQVKSIQVIPLFPQYASASTGSTLQKTMELLSQWPTIPDLSWVHSFHDNALMIDTFVENGRKYNLHTFDHVLFSFHGLPESQLKDSDHTQRHCLQVKDCCARIIDKNRFCYGAQSYQTAKLIAKKLELLEDQYTVCFQSRLGRRPWLKPYTQDIIQELGSKGAKRLLVFCPAFVADCLETIYEVSIEYQQAFQALGGEKLQLVESLNDQPQWIQALEHMVKPTIQ